MNIIPAIFYPGIVGLVIFAIALFKYPRWAIAGMIVIKPLIDTTWNYSILLDINFLQIYAGAFTILGIVFIAARRFKILACPVCPTWLVFLLLNFVSIFFISGFPTKLYAMSYFLRIVNGFVTLILFAYVFDFNKDKKFIVFTFLLSGLLPIGLWLSQAFSGNPVTSIVGFHDELRRIVGPYHNFFNFMFYAQQTVIMCLTCLAIDEQNDTQPVFQGRLVVDVYRFIKRPRFAIHCAIYILALIGIIIVYKCYSKSGWFILLFIPLLWFIIRKKILPAIAVLAVVILSVTINPFARETRSIFYKEIDVIVNKSDNWSTDTLFMGRYGRWDKGLASFRALKTVNKLFGTDIRISDPGNDFFRILWRNGIVGLGVFLFLLAQVSYLLIIQYRKNKDPVALTAILVLVVYFFIANGFYPMLSPNFQWFMWGIIGFVLSGQKARKSACGIDKNHGIGINGIESSTL